MRTRRVDLGEVELAVAEAGEGGRPLLLLHGFTGAKEDFGDWLDWLADLGWHAVAPDHRGHGESAKPEGRGAYSMAILAGDALALADALGWDRFVLLGHSMGGYVAQRIALADPGRLAGLVLMDTGHSSVAGIEPAQVETAGKLAVESGMDAMADLMAEVDSPLDTPAHRRLVAEQPAYAAFEDRKLRATSPWLYASLSHELVTCPDVLDRLAAVIPTPPTLVVVGEQDTPFVPAAMRMAHAVPGATLGVVADAGHSPQFENPAGWWQVVSAFLDRIA
ncbi:MAG: alpha/beta hydrolase [Acidobacteriota bacterium]|nr:alpha/beta hydrolase [Acidobacteriota bacterium]